MDPFTSVISLVTFIVDTDRIRMFLFEANDELQRFRFEYLMDLNMVFKFGQNKLRRMSYRDVFYTL